MDCGAYPSGNPLLQALARQYAQRAGLGHLRESCPVKVKEAECDAIAAAYDAGKSDPGNGQVRRAYRALTRELRAQLSELQRAGVRIEYTDTDPYAGSKEMFQDVCANKRLKVFSGCSIHPAMSCKENRVFRAVHDLFGHAARGYSFSRDGEESAWVEHSKLFTPWAREALTTETRGQNNWFNCARKPDGSPVNESGKAKTYAPQKAMLLPSKYWSRPDVPLRACPRTMAPDRR